MSVDNRTDINDCEDDNVNFSTTGGALNTNTAVGNYIEGTASVQFLHSNVYDHTYTVDDSAGTALSINMSDVTYYILVKANGWSTYSVAAQNLVLGDGTDEIGYATGGSDATGVPIQKQFYSLKLDCSDAAANPGAADVGHHVYAGTEANLDFTAISLVGYGSLHSAKAQGNVANTWIDAMSYIANDSYALTVNGGTVGTPETTADVVSDDEGGLLTGLGYGGLVSNPAGSLYLWAGPTEWGNSGAVADVYYTATDEQWYWVGDNLGGRALGATHFPMRVVGNATDTIDVKWTNVVIVNTGTRAQFLAGDTNTNVMQFDGVSFTDVGTITYTTQSAGSRFANSCIYNNCDQVYFNTMDMTGGGFNGTTDPNGALLIDDNSNVENQDNIVFNSDGTGHGIYINLNTASLTTLNISGWEASDYDGTGAGPAGGSTGNELFLIDNALDGDVTINVTGGVGTFNDFQKAAGYTGTVTVNQTVTLSLTGIETDSEVRIINLDDVENFNRELAGNDQIHGEVLSATIADGGSGYTNGTQTLTVVGGTGTAATIEVTVAGGIVTSVDAITGAGDYTVNPPTPATTSGGGGTGCTLRLTIRGSFDYTYDAGLGANVAIIVFHLNFREVRIEQVIPSVTSSIPIQQSTDRTYNNP